MIEKDAPVTWTYIFTNTGILTLTNLSLVDDQIGVIGPNADNTCIPPGTLLGPGKSLTCTVVGVAQPGQYENFGTITGDSITTEIFTQTQTVTDTNPSHYFGSAPAIEIIKFTNGEDADDAPGPNIQVGDPVTWTYQVRNLGNVALSNVVVVDNMPGVTPVYVSGDANSNSLLDVDETWLYQATGTAIEGQYENTGTVTGTPPVGTDVSDDNPSHYFGTTSEPPPNPGIAIVKFTNGPGGTPRDADKAPGPMIQVGDTVTWTYQVENTGDVPLSNVTVVDNIPGVNPHFVSGDTNSNSLLDVDETWLYQATGVAVEGQYANIGSVTGTPPTGPNVSDDNPSHYFGANPGIEIIKFTNGEDADDAPGINLRVGDPVTWTYQVRNTGNIALNHVVVKDNIPGVAPAYVSGDANGNSLLDVGEVLL
jgi:uncharacterized repeat protein (TIGR01451 family)